MENFEWSEWNGMGARGVGGWGVEGRVGGWGEEAKRKRGIKIFSEQNGVMTKYPPGVCRAEGVSGKGGAPWQG